MVFVLAACAVATWVFLHRPEVLTEKDTLILGEFTNSTGGPVFGGALRQGLIVQLEQSPFLSLVSEPRIHHTLQLMGKPGISFASYSGDRSPGLRADGRRRRNRSFDRTSWK